MGGLWRWAHEGREVGQLSNPGYYTAPPSRTPPFSGSRVIWPYKRIEVMTFPPSVFLSNPNGYNLGRQGILKIPAMIILTLRWLFWTLWHWLKTSAQKNDKYWIVSVQQRLFAQESTDDLRFIFSCLLELEQEKCKFIDIILKIFHSDHSHFGNKSNSKPFHLSLRFCWAVRLVLWSIYCTHSIVIWNQTWNISELCL